MGEAFTYQSFFMKWKSMWVLVLLLVGSCQDVNRPERPENLISKGKMADILCDAYLSNAARNINPKRIRDSGIKLDSLLYKKYQVDSLQFAKSNEFYAANIKDYTEIIEQVEVKLKVLQVKSDTLLVEIEKQRICDSIIASDTLTVEEKRLNMHIFDSIRKVDSIVRLDSLKVVPKLIDPVEGIKSQNSFE